MSETSKQEDWNEQETLSQIEELLGDGNMEDVIKQNIVAEGKDYFDELPRC